MRAEKEFKIPFAGLSLSKHTYNLKVNDKFFDLFEFSEIKKGDLNVEVVLNKQTSMLIFDFIISGKVEVMCDRCTEDFMLPIHSENHLIVKLGNENFEENDQIVSIPGTDHEIDLSHFIYEYIILSIPARRVHPDVKGKPGCDEEVIKKLEKISVKEEQQEADPRWDALKKLKKN